VLVSWFLAPALRCVWAKYPPVSERAKCAAELVELLMLVYATSFSVGLTTKELDDVGELLLRVEPLLVKVQTHPRVSYINHQVHHIASSIRNLGMKVMAENLCVLALGGHHSCTWCLCVTASLSLYLLLTLLLHRPAATDCDLFVRALLSRTRPPCAQGLGRDANVQAVSP